MFLAFNYGLMYVLSFATIFTLSGGLLAPTVALALVASLLYAQPVIRAYWWMAAAAAQLH